jgi:predicted AAA+ superfamily ATPase
VGKTVLLHQLADELLERGWPPGNLTYFDFSDDRLTAPVPARDVEEARPNNMNPDRPRVFLLDEIRLAPRWSTWLKQAVDQRRGCFVATDSAASLLRAGSRESGQGRWDEYTAEGWLFPEYLRLLARKDEKLEELLERVPAVLDRYLVCGGFPEHALSEDLERSRSRIREDIANRAILRDLLHTGADVTRIKDLFVYLAQSSGSLADLGKLAGSLGDADRRSLRHWLALLEGTLLIHLLPRRGGPSVRLRSKSKVFASDAGLVAAFAAIAQPLTDSRVRGSLVETAVYRHLREAARIRPGLQLAYYGEDRADFVVDSNEGPIPIEVTAGTNVAEKIDQLETIARDLDARRALVVHGGMTGLPVTGRRSVVRTVPLMRFLLDPVSWLEEPAHAG